MSSYSDSSDEFDPFAVAEAARKAEEAAKLAAKEAEKIQSESKQEEDELADEVEVPMVTSKRTFGGGVAQEVLKTNLDDSSEEEEKRASPIEDLTFLPTVVPVLDRIEKDQLLNKDGLKIGKVGKDSTKGFVLEGRKTKAYCEGMVKKVPKGHSLSG
jgi:hypothetical protein